MYLSWSGVLNLWDCLNFLFALSLNCVYFRLLSDPWLFYPFNSLTDSSTQRLLISKDYLANAGLSTLSIIKAIICSLTLPMCIGWKAQSKVCEDNRNNLLLNFDLKQDRDWIVLEIAWDFLWSFSYGVILRKKSVTLWYSISSKISQK